MKTHRPLVGVAVAVALSFAVFNPVRVSTAQAPPGPQAAPTGEKVELLFVQNALTGSFDGKTLILKGVGLTLFFSDRPERVTGHLGTPEFVGHWDKGPDSFAKNPPNATLSIFGDKEVTSVVVELTRPRLDRTTLSYQAKVLTGKLPASFKESSLFIDVLGRWRMAARGMAVGEMRGAQMAAASRPPAPAQPAAAPAPAPVAAAAPPAPAVNVTAAAPAGVTEKQAAAVTKLKELKSLLNQGLITQSQYQADSQKLLNQIVE
jgi:hypothetical protein